MAEITIAALQAELAAAHARIAELEAQRDDAARAHQELREKATAAFVAMRAERDAALAARPTAGALPETRVVQLNGVAHTKSFARVNGRMVATYRPVETAAA